MIDSRIRPVIDPISDHIGKGLVRLGLTANMVTIIGGFFGLFCLLCAVFSVLSLGVDLYFVQPCF